MKRECIIVKHQGVSYTVMLDDILYIESSNKKVILHTRSHALAYCGQMGAFENIRPYFRCHRCYIVNMRHVASYSSKAIALVNGREILMSRRRYSAFERAYLEFLAIQVI